MNSRAYQYYKLNGRYIGEVDMDAYIAASHGMPSRFFAGGDIACSQAARAVDGIVTVVTKRELERNRAEFRNNDELFADIKREIVKAVSTEAEPVELEFPAVMEKSCKRVEDAAKYLQRMRSLGLASDHPKDEILGKDAHTVVTTVNDIEEFIKSI
jgi:D-aminopeptidase